MVLCTSEIIEQTSKFLKVTNEKVTTNSNGEITLQPKKSKELLKGFATILKYITTASNSEYAPKNNVETALLYQWLEHCVCVLNYADTQQTAALNDINKILSQRSYLIGNRCTVADIIYYYILYPIMEGLTLQEKENYCHLSRWFSLIQITKGIRNDSNKYKQLIFSRNTIYS